MSSISGIYMRETSICGVYDTEAVIIISRRSLGALQSHSTEERHEAMPACNGVIKTGAVGGVLRVWLTRY